MFCCYLTCTNNAHQHVCFVCSLSSLCLFVCVCFLLWFSSHCLCYLCYFLLIYLTFTHISSMFVLFALFLLCVFAQERDTVFVSGRRRWAERDDQGQFSDIVDPGRSSAIDQVFAILCSSLLSLCWAFLFFSSLSFALTCGLVFDSYALCLFCFLLHLRYDCRVEFFFSSFFVYCDWISAFFLLLLLLFVLSDFSSFQRLTHLRGSDRGGWVPQWAPRWSKELITKGYRKYWGLRARARNAQRRTAGENVRFFSNKARRSVNNFFNWTVEWCQ